MCSFVEFLFLSGTSLSSEIAEPPLEDTIAKLLQSAEASQVHQAISCGNVDAMVTSVVQVTCGFLLQMSRVRTAAKLDQPRYGSNRYAASGDTL